MSEPADADESPDRCGGDTERCKYSVEVECDPEAAPTVANAWMVFCNTVREVNGAEITDARADPEGVERSEPPRKTDGGTELVRCTRGHTVSKSDCTAIVGRLICPICECRIPDPSTTEVDR